MRKQTWFALILTVCLPSLAFAAGGSGYPLEHAPIDGGNKSSLRRGAATFVNYCMGCHGASFSMYGRIGEDLDIPDEIVSDNLIFTTDKNGDKDKVGALMRTSMSQDFAKNAFGALPPDLSLIARSRGADWLYNYLLTFYVDESRPMGANNAVFANVGMPHVLWELEGTKRAIFEQHHNEDGTEVSSIVGFEQITEGKLSTEEYRETVKDLVNFLAYVAEPYKSERIKFGVYALLFLLIFSIAAYRLKKEYWKDIQ